MNVEKLMCVSYVISKPKSSWRYFRKNEFLSRRLQPAIRTTEAFSRRLESLATRAQRADNLVRTQIEMGVQIQNKNLLESMELRARAQLRLQETVESLSIVAITY